MIEVIHVRGDKIKCYDVKKISHHCDIDDRLASNHNHTVDRLPIRFQHGFISGTIMKNVVVSKTSGALLAFRFTVFIYNQCK